MVEYLLRCPHNAYDLLSDEKFVYSLMKIAIKDDHHRTIESFVFVSPAPADMAAKLSAIYREMADTDKERAADLEAAADKCEELARTMVVLGSHIESPGQGSDILLKKIVLPHKQTVEAPVSPLLGLKLLYIPSFKLILY